MYQKLLLLVILLIFTGVSCSGINLPYVGFHSFNFNIYSLIAHNYIAFGFYETQLAPVISVSELVPKNPSYYLHHPPLVTLVMVGLFQIFGEHFWVGRLAVIIFSIGSMLLLYLIGLALKGKKFALLVLTAGCLMPASALFGRMIGQEALVLFFALLCLYSLILYLQSAKKRFLLGIFFSIFLGTVSDWPMVYFVAALFPYLMLNRRLTLYLWMLLLAASTAAGYLLYILYIQGSVTDLISAFFVRSFEAHNGDYWLFRWLVLLALRFVVYFNPLFMLISLIGIYQLFFTKLSSLFKHEKPLLFSLWLFGLTHVMLYPAGSFGHPYWIYYFVPFIALLVARTVFNVSKLFLLALVVLSILFLVKAEQWKTGETRANVWRYSLAQAVSQRVPKYERIAVNRDSAMDFDVLRYAFLIDFIQTTPQQFDESINYYAYSCMGECDNRASDLSYLQQRYQVSQVKVAEGELYLFNLQQPIEDWVEKSLSQSEERRVKNNSHQSTATTLQKMHTFFIEWLDAPQI